MILYLQIFRHSHGLCTLLKLLEVNFLSLRLLLEIGGQSYTTVAILRCFAICEHLAYL